MASKTEQRKIEIIANGKKFNSSFKEMSASARILENQLKKMPRHTKEWAAKSKELKTVKKNLNAMRTEMRGTQGAMSKISGLFSPMTLGFAGVALAIRGVFNTIKEFQQGVANLASVLGTTRDGITALTADAKQLGATTKFTATEVVGLQTAYAKLGFAENEILNVTDATLELAAATGSDLAQSAEVAGGTLRGFGLEATEMQRVVDVMAQSFSSSALDLEKFNVGMRSVAPVAKAAGKDIEWTTSKLGVLANNSVDASTAGTALRNMLLRLSASGQSWGDAMEEINNSTNKLKTAQDLFGVKASAVALILAEQGDAAAKLEDQLRSSGGAAEEMARVQLDTLQGSVTLLSSAWDGFILGLESGDGFLGKIIRTIIDATTAFFGFITPVEKASNLLVKQQEEVNTLVFKLGDLNLKETERAKAIKKLNKVAPELVKTLNKEGVATSKTRKALDKLNNSYVANIALQIKAEEIKKVATKEAELRLEYIERENQLTTQLAKIEKEGTDRQKLIISQAREAGITNDELSQSLISVADKEEIGNNRRGKGTKILDENIRMLDSYNSRVFLAKERLEKASTATQRLREETDKLKKSFIDSGSIVKGVANDVEGAITGSATTTSEQLDEIQRGVITNYIEYNAEKVDIGDVYNKKAAQKFAKFLSDQKNKEKQSLDDRFKALKESNNKRLKELNEAQQKELDKLTDWQKLKDDTINGLKEQGWDAAKQINAAAFANLAQQRGFAYDEERKRVAEQYDTEVLLLREKLDKGQITEEKFASQKQALEKQQAEDIYNIKVAEFKADKKAAIGKIAIDTAIAVAKAIASSPLTFGLPWSAYALVQGGVQAAVVGLQKPPPRPQFATGGLTDVGTFKYGGHITQPSIGEIAENGKPEWVGPNWMLESPMFADIFSYLEGERIRGNRQFASGGSTVSGTTSGNSGPGLSDEMKALRGDVQRLTAVVASWPTKLQVHNNVQDTVNKIQVLNDIENDSQIMRLSE